MGLLSRSTSTFNDGMGVARIPTWENASVSAQDDLSTIRRLVALFMVFNLASILFLLSKILLKPSYHMGFWGSLNKNHCK
jgi:hypothetical protein